MKATARDYRRLPPQHMFWEMDCRGVYLVLDGKRQRVRNVAILANGTKDLQIVEGPGGWIGFALAGQPFEGQVLHTPLYDLAVFEFEEQLPAPYLMPYLVLEIDEELAPFIREICRRWPMARHEDYDAHLGGQYWRVS